MDRKEEEPMRRERKKGEALRPGPYNAITDVKPVRVGHVTLVKGEGPLRPGEGPVRTGVTAILPGEDVFGQKLALGMAVLNGFGKAVGLPQAMELGRLETPILLTNTFSTWRAAEALVQHVLRRHPEVGIRLPTVNPVVAECNDGFLNDLQGMHVEKEHVWEALERAQAGPVPQGAVGAGTGMVAFGWKGGIGTSSRVFFSQTLEREVTVGALVLSNYGRPEELILGGYPLGLYLQPPKSRPREEQGSVIVILATDAPLTARQLTRIARRGAVGLDRTGSIHHHGSGDFVLAFSTAGAYPPFLPDEGSFLTPFFQAAAVTTAEAVARSLLSAGDMEGRDGHLVRGLPPEAVARVFREQGWPLPSFWPWD
ncbi:MAG: P1 family peptidase [Bacillota bacterium]|nr:P1 family peptidase [Bacillota bacterium]